MAAQTINFSFSDPLYLHPSDAPGVSLVSEPLIGTENYGVWSRAMLLALRAKNKLGFINGSCRKPADNHLTLHQWERCNAIVLSWTDPEDVVRESTDLTISFSPGILYLPAVWKVDEYDAAAEQYFVTAGEIDSNETSINTFFQIRKESGARNYWFSFCPRVCEFCAKICTNVGIHVDLDDGVRLLALDGSFPTTFMFKKKDE